MELKQSGLFLARTLSYEVRFHLTVFIGYLPQGHQVCRFVLAPPEAVAALDTMLKFPFEGGKRRFVFLRVGRELRAAAGHHRAGVQGALQQRNPCVARGVGSALLT